MLDSSPHNGTGYMEGDNKGWGRGGDGVWFIQPVGYGGTIPLGNYTDALGDGWLLADTIPPESRGGSIYHVITFRT